MRRSQYIGWGIFTLAAMSFIGGLIGGFLGVGVLDGVIFDRDADRKVILQESSIIIETVEELKPSVVSIETETQDQTDIFGRRLERREGAGTGVIVSDDGIVLTNKHVVPKDRNIIVRDSNGEKYENVEVIDRDPFNDIAYLKLNTDKELQAAQLGDSDKVSVGQRVIAVGNALGEFSNTVTSGIISGIGRPVTAAGGEAEVAQLQGLFQTDAAINPGNSGGPLVNIEGQVIGINTAIAGNAENIGFAIPINQVVAGLESIEEHGRLIKPFLGIRYVMLTPELSKQEGLNVTEGAYLPADERSIVSGGPAEKADIKPGDVITKVDGEKVTRDKPLALILGQHQAGDSIKLTLLRNGEEKKITVELGEVPENIQN